MTERNHSRGVLFDLGWTLLYPASGDWFVTGAVLARLGKDAFPAIGRPRLETAFAAGARVFDERPLIRTEAEEEELFAAFYRTVAGQLPELGLTPADCAEFARDHTYNAENYRFFEDSAAVVGAVRAEYRVGILSDTWPSLSGVLSRAGLLELFDSVTFSCHVGVTKPHPDIYRAALSAIGLPGERVSFVDDMPQNLAAAAGFGIAPVHIDVRGLGEDAPSWPRIRRLSELPAHLAAS